MMVKCMELLHLAKNWHEIYVQCNRRKGHKGDHWGWRLNGKGVLYQVVWEQNTDEEEVTQ